MLSGALLAPCCCWVKQLHSNREAVQHTAVHRAIATCRVGCVGEGEGERGGRVEQCRSTAVRLRTMLCRTLLAPCCCWVKQLDSNREAVQHTAVHRAIAICGVCVGRGGGQEV
jgi:hypothetical protein